MGERGKNPPLKGTKHDRSLNNTTHIPKPGATADVVIIRQVRQIRMKHRHRDEPSEPEQHRQRIDRQEGKNIGDLVHEAGGQGEVDEYQQRPDGGEEEEGILRGGSVIGCDCWRVVVSAGWTDMTTASGGWSEGKEGRVRTMACEPELDDGEQSLHGADGEEDEFEHSLTAGGF